MLHSKQSLAYLRQVERSLTYSSRNFRYVLYSIAGQKAVDMGGFPIGHHHSITARLAFATPPLSGSRNTSPGRSLFSASPNQLFRRGTIILGQPTPSIHSNCRTASSLHVRYVVDGKIYKAIAF